MNRVLEDAVDHKRRDVCDIIEMRAGEANGYYPGEEALVQAPPGGGYLLGWGHLISAFYKVHKQQEGHPMVVLNIHRGIPHWHIWVHNLPRDATEFIAAGRPGHTCNNMILSSH